MIEPTAPEPLGFTDTARILREKAPEMFEAAVRHFNVPTWRRMLADLHDQKPSMYRRLGRNLLALKREGEEPQLKVRQELQGVIQELSQTYRCDRGFIDRAPQTQAVTVRLRYSRVVTGLPRDIMRLNNKLALDHGGVNKWTFGFDNRVFVADLTEEAIERLRADNMVESVEVEPIAHIMSSEIPQYNPAAVNTDWGVDRCYPTNAWTKGLKGEGVNLCIIDTGIKSDHIAFWHNGETNFMGGWNFVAGNNNPADDHDHGTYCAGIVGHRHTGVNGHYRGIAPNINLYVCKALDAKGSGSFANIAAAIDWARTNGMHIVSLSLGGASGSTVLQAACDAAWYAGLVLCASTGNDGSPTNISYPAKYQSVIGVPAADFYDNIAVFSNQGPEAEITGPGVAIVGPWAGFTYDDYVVANSNNLYMCASGTSAACPHVAACAALVKQWYPSITNVALRDWLRTHARDL